MRFVIIDLRTTKAAERRFFPFDTLTPPPVADWLPFVRPRVSLMGSEELSTTSRRFPAGLWPRNDLGAWAKRKVREVYQPPDQPDQPARRYPLFRGFQGQLLLVQRDPDAPQRTRQHLDLVATILNSLIRQGVLVQTGPQEWTINL